MFVEMVTVKVLMVTVQYSYGLCKVDMMTHLVGHQKLIYTCTGYVVKSDLG